MKRKILSLCFAALVALFLGGPTIASAANPEAIVCDFALSTVSIFDVANPSTPATTVSTGAGSIPIVLAITPNASQAWVCDQITNTISVIDLASKAVAGTIALAANPSAGAIRPDGSEALVVTPTGLSFFNVATRVLETSIAISGSPIGVAITPDNTQAWVTQNSTDSVAVIDLASRSMVMQVLLPSGFSPLSISMTPNGTQACIVDPKNWTGKVVNFMLLKSLSMETKYEQSTEDPTNGGL